jgi:hypothetical protein
MEIKERIINIILWLINYLGLCSSIFNNPLERVGFILSVLSTGRTGVLGREQPGADQRREGEGGRGGRRRHHDHLVSRDLGPRLLQPARARASREKTARRATVTRPQTLLNLIYLFSTFRRTLGEGSVCYRSRTN